jgi:DegT/DnrJ/EryC1/StrS aminotransferase family protein
MKVPLSSPDITEAEIEAVVAVLRTPRLSLGPVSEQFEAAVADYIGVPHAMAVSSGTAGLHLCIHALGIGEGDEVIVPSFAFIAAANAIRYERAMPVFVDIDPVTLNIDPQTIEPAITPRTRAIMVVHTFGFPADMTAILDIAERHGLLVIEDACEAIGAMHRGSRLAPWGMRASLPFTPTSRSQPAKEALWSRGTPRSLGASARCATRAGMPATTGFNTLSWDTTTVSPRSIALWGWRRWRGWKRFLPNAPRSLPVISNGSASIRS